MTLVTTEFKEGIQKLFDRLSSPDDPGAAMGPTVATATLTGPQTSVATWPNYKVTSDEPKSVGGGDTAPPPSSIFVASIGFAENVIFARQAALQGVDFDSLETKVEANWDRKGIFGIANSDPSIFDVLIETRIATGSSPEKVVELVRLTGERCPMTRTVAKAAKVRRKLVVNGAEVPVS
ncbi:MAG TPA: OsmC family protein [Nitrososphaerales archaeon]|nr:OsmC family protein [Nitrososphaerales archaeon]